MSDSNEEKSTTVIVTHMGVDGRYEVIAMEFLKGLAGFTQWAEALPKAITRVESGGRNETVGDLVSYNTISAGNTVAVSMQPGGVTRQYSWEADEMGWNYMKSLVADQDRSTVTHGRPPKLVQPLQTWKKWAKKDGAIL